MNLSNRPKDSHRYQTISDTVKGKPGNGFNTCFGNNILSVCQHRVVTDIQLLCDLLVEVALYDELQDLRFTVRQLAIVSVLLMQMIIGDGVL